MGKRRRRKLRNFLIDSKVQLRITLVMVALSSVLTAILGFFWYGEIRRASDMIRVNAISVLGSDAARQLETELLQQDHQRLVVLVGFALLLGLLIAGYGIVMTHKLAGPLYKINRHMNDVAEGRLYKLWGLRRGDQLQEFFQSFDRMHGALRERVEEDMKLLNRVVAGIESGGDLPGLVPSLREALVAKGESLREASEVTQQLRRPTK